MSGVERHQPLVRCPESPDAPMQRRRRRSTGVPPVNRRSTGVSPVIMAETAMLRGVTAKMAVLPGR